MADNFFRIQMDAEGNEIDSDALDKELGSEAAPAAQVNAQAHKFSLQQGRSVEQELHLADAQEKIDGFVEELDRIEVLKASGDGIDNSARKHIRGTMEDIAIAWVDRARGSLDDPELAALRARVGALIGS